MQKTLLTITKLIPKLGTTNSNEKMTTLLMIEKLFAKESLSWTDVGQQLAAFLTDTLKFSEEEALAPPAEAPIQTTGWHTPGAARPAASAASAGAASGWRTGASPPPPPKPPRPIGDGWKFDAAANNWFQVPKPSSPGSPNTYGGTWTWSTFAETWNWRPNPKPAGPDPRVNGTLAEQLAVCNELISKRKWKNPKEQQNLQAIRIQLDRLKLKLTPSQHAILSKLSARL